MKFTNNLRHIVLLLFLSLSGQAALAINTDRLDVKRFIDSMVLKHEYDRKTLVSLLREAKTQTTILEAISRPAEKIKSWNEYRAIFLTNRRIKAGVDFWINHQSELQKISNETGVPCEILVGIIGVETSFGSFTGGYRVLDALSTLTFDYKPRASFFRRELEEFLLLVREENIEASEATGSYAGAMGLPQFMPSSFRAYAVDSNADGKRNIWTNWTRPNVVWVQFFQRHGNLRKHRVGR